MEHTAAVQTSPLFHSTVNMHSKLIKGVALKGVYTLWHSAWAGGDRHVYMCSLTHTWSERGTHTMREYTHTYIHMCILTGACTRSSILTEAHTHWACMPTHMHTVHTVHTKGHDPPNTASPAPHFTSTAAACHWKQQVRMSLTLLIVRTGDEMRRFQFYYGWLRLWPEQGDIITDVNGLIQQQSYVTIKQTSKLVSAALYMPYA